MNGTRIKMRHLHCFLEVARAGSLDAAAERMAVDRGAVADAIDQLEAQLGARLFETVDDELRLTGAGRRLEPYAWKGMAVLLESVMARIPRESAQGA